MADRLRVALCDDHAIVREGIRRILEEEPDIDVVGGVSEAGMAVLLAGDERPDVFVMDLTLSGESGITATRNIRRASPDTRVLVLTMHNDVAYLKEAIAAGAAGYILKEAADIELVRAVREVAAGRRYVHPTLGAALLDQGSGGDKEPEPVVPGLSDREAEILRLLALGFTNPEMASSLHLSVRTIEAYRAKLQQKLGLRSRAELARLARQAGLV